MQRQARICLTLVFGLLCGLICLSISHVVIAQTQEKIVETDSIKLSYQQLEDDASTVKIQFTVKETLQDPIVGIELIDVDLQKFKPIKNEQIVDITNEQIKFKPTTNQSEYQISFEQVIPSDSLSFSIRIFTQKENENQKELPLDTLYLPLDTILSQKETVSTEVSTSESSANESIEETKSSTRSTQETKASSTQTTDTTSQIVEPSTNEVTSKSVPQIARTLDTPLRALNTNNYTQQYDNQNESPYVNNYDFINNSGLFSLTANAFDTNYQMFGTDGNNLVRKIVRPTEEQNTFEVQLDVIGKQLKTQKNLDVVIVLDQSGSMNKNSKWTNSIQAIKNFSTSLLVSNSNNRLGIVTFGSKDGTIYAQLNNMGKNGSVQYFTNTSDSIEKNLTTPSGSSGTPTFFGLETGMYLLNDLNTRADSQKVLICLTDGEPSYWLTDSTYKSFASKVKDKTVTESTGTYTMKISGNRSLAGDGYSYQKSNDKIYGKDNYTSGIQKTTEFITNLYAKIPSISKFAINLVNTVDPNKQQELTDLQTEYMQFKNTEPKYGDYFLRYEWFFIFRVPIYDTQKYSQDLETWNEKNQTYQTKIAELDAQVNSNASSSLTKNQLASVTKFLNVLAPNGLVQSDPQSMSDLAAKINEKLASLKSTLLNAQIAETISNQVILVPESVSEERLLIANNQVQVTEKLTETQSRIQDNQQKIVIDSLTLGGSDTTREGYRLRYQVRLKPESMDWAFKTTSTTTITNQNQAFDNVKNPQIRNQMRRITIDKQWNTTRKQSSEKLEYHDYQLFANDQLVTNDAFNGTIDGILLPSKIETDDGISYGDLPMRDRNGQLIKYRVNHVYRKINDQYGYYKVNLSATNFNNDFGTALYPENSASAKYTLKTADFSFTKMDQNNPLKNVAFSLRSNSEEVQNVQSNQNGKVQFNGLAKGEYTLVESTPLGYQKLADQVVKVVDQGAENVTIDTAATQIKNGELQNKLKPFVMTIETWNTQQTKKLTKDTTYKVMKNQTEIKPNADGTYHLVPGQYELEQLKTHADYVLAPMLSFEITQENQLRIHESLNSIFSGTLTLTPSDDANRLDLKVLNMKKGQLPETGGNGHRLTMILSLLLVTCASMIALVLGLQNIRGGK